MKETIEAWCVVYGSSRSIWNTESDARQQALLVNGTVVRLTGELPKRPRKVSTELWVGEAQVIDTRNTYYGLYSRIGINGWSLEKNKDCPIRARITMEELSDEN